MQALEDGLSNKARILFERAKSFAQERRAELVKPIHLLHIFLEEKPEQVEWSKVLNETSWNTLKKRVLTALQEDTDKAGSVAGLNSYLERAIHLALEEAELGRHISCQTKLIPAGLHDLFLGLLRCEDPETRTLLIAYPLLTVKSLRPKLDHNSRAHRSGPHFYLKKTTDLLMEARAHVEEYKPHQAPEDLRTFIDLLDKALSIANKL